jgi:multicomponent Na+:H+ antiporter subunit D
LIIIIAAVQAGHFIFALLAVLASIITLAYYLKLQNMAFFGKLSGLLNHVKEAPAFMCISMVVLAILSIVMGALLIPGVREIVLDPACDVIINAGNYSKVILGG